MEDAIFTDDTILFTEGEIELLRGSFRCCGCGHLDAFHHDNPFNHKRYYYEVRVCNVPDCDCKIEL